MSAATVVRGIAWNHSRALPALVATAQRFEELNPGVEIHWEKRSLHDFGHADLLALAERYDLFVIDHPMMGRACESHALLDLSRLLDPSYIENLSADSVGQSYRSYWYEGRLLALPIDAAAPAASFRSDLLKRAGVQVPKTWDEVLDLARKKLVVMPGFHVDVFLNFVGMYLSRQREVAMNPEEFVDRDTARECLEDLSELARCLPDEIYAWNPISVYEHLAAGDQYAYCPFAYSYSNYSRAGFAEHLVLFANTASLRDGLPLRTVLGGTGIAISARSEAARVSLEYSTHVAGAEWQRTLYGLSGGQPARRSAWQDETLNQVANGFFRQTLESVETAHVRPRYPGYIEFQAHAGLPIVEYLQSGGSSAKVVVKLNNFYRASRKRQTPAWKSP